MRLGGDPLLSPKSLPPLGAPPSRGSSLGPDLQEPPPSLSPKSLLGGDALLGGPSSLPPARLGDDPLGEASLLLQAPPSPLGGDPLLGGEPLLGGGEPRLPGGPSSSLRSPLCPPLGPHSSSFLFSLSLQPPPPPPPLHAPLLGPSSSFLPPPARQAPPLSPPNLSSRELSLLSLRSLSNFSSISRSFSLFFLSIS